MSVKEQHLGHVTVVTLDREEARNAVDAHTAAQLAAAIRRFRDDETSHALVLTGAGDVAFCAGADLKDIPNLLGAEEFCDTVGPMGFAKLDPQKVTIAAINGYCFAGGLELAAWCDFRIADAHSEFGALNRSWGVPFFDGGTQRLPRIVGLGNALWMMLTGVRFDAERAREVGFVQEVVPSGTALKRAVELAQQIAGYPQTSLRNDRRVILASGGLSMADGLSSEDEARRECMTDQEMIARLEAFARGERPVGPRVG